jgi:hypothetical protein
VDPIHALVDVVVLLAVTGVYGLEMGARNPVHLSLTLLACVVYPLSTLSLEHSLHYTRLALGPKTPRLELALPLLLVGIAATCTVTGVLSARTQDVPFAFLYNSTVTALHVFALFLWLNVGKGQNYGFMAAANKTLQFVRVALFLF